VAEQINLTLPPEYERKRRAWERRREPSAAEAAPK
jgi:hypothetical protein